MWMQVAGAASYNNQVVNLEGGKKLRTLIPRPSSSSSSSSCNPTSRWNPTAEQVGTLEELYSHGTRTPSTQEIQVITAHLRRYGNIEGKNVFYWFQNHKARERHKRRRLLPTIHRAQHSKEIGEMSMQLERGGAAAAETGGRRGVSVSDVLSKNTTTSTTTTTAATTITRRNIGSRAVASQTNAKWCNLAPSASSSSCAIFKTRRLVATVTDGTSTTTHRERELECEEQDSAPLLQLFPLTTLVKRQEQGEESSKEYKHKQMMFTSFSSFLPRVLTRTTTTKLIHPCMMHPT